jgi:hypothetical protein
VCRIVVPWPSRPAGGENSNSEILRILLRSTRYNDTSATHNPKASIAAVEAPIKNIKSAALIMALLQKDRGRIPG